MGAVFSKLTSGLTNTGVQQPGPGGATQYYPDPATATAAASKQIPSADAMMGPDVLNPNMSAPPLPKVSQPTFAQAQGQPGALTTKGSTLTLLINAGLGALAGDAAARQGSPRTGYPAATAGAVAGMEFPFKIREQQNALTQQQLEHQKEQAQIAALPQQSQAVLAETKARTDYYNAGANRRENFSIPGVGLVDSSGKVIVAAPDAGDKAQAALDVRKQEAQNAKMDPEQALQYIYGIKPDKTQVSEFAGYVAKAGGNISRAVDLKRQADFNDKVAFHAAIQKTTDVDNGLSANQQRALGADPEYAALKGEQSALSRKLGEMDSNSFVLPADVTAARASAADLATKMTAAKNRILKGNAPASNVAPVASHSPQQPFTHVSSDGKWGWNGTAWVGTGKK